VYSAENTGLPACTSTDIHLPLLVPLKPGLCALLVPEVFKCPRCSCFSGGIGDKQAPPLWWDADLVPVPRVHHFPDVKEMVQQCEPQAYMNIYHYREYINKMSKSEKLRRFSPSLSKGSFRDLTFQSPNKSYQKTLQVLPSSLLGNSLCILDITIAFATCSKYDKQAHLSSILKIYKFYTF